MKRLLIRVAFFLLPVLLFVAPAFLFYKTDRGDLMKLGYLQYRQDYNRKEIFKDYELPVRFYKQLKNINLDTVSKFDVFTVGDSFTNQDEWGFHNYLAAYSKYSVLNADGHIIRSTINAKLNDPIEFLQGILKGDFFDKVSVKYVVLETVERSIGFAANLPATPAIRLSNDTIASINHRFYAKVNAKKLEAVSHLDRAYKTNLNSFYYLFRDNGYKVPIYRTATDYHLFSYDSDNLLFFGEDVKNSRLNSNVDTIKAFNNVLNDLAMQLAAKNIKLLVIAAPDKYDVYYDYIKNKATYPRPQLYKILDSLPKSYTYVDAKALLTTAVTTQKDVYLYDDTHWSPVAAKLVANRLMQQLDALGSTQSLGNLKAQLALSGARK